MSIRVAVVAAILLFAGSSIARNSFGVGAGSLTIQGFASGPQVTAHHTWDLSPNQRVRVMLLTFFIYTQAQVEAHHVFPVTEAGHGLYLGAGVGLALLLNPGSRHQVAPTVGLLAGYEHLHHGGKRSMFLEALPSLWLGGPFTFATRLGWNFYY